LPGEKTGKKGTLKEYQGLENEESVIPQGQGEKKEKKMKEQRWTCRTWRSWETRKKKKKGTRLVERE